MGQFEYQAVDETGMHVSGTIVATDRKNAVATLAQKGHYVSKLMAREEGGKTAAARPTKSAVAKEVRTVSLGRGRIKSRDILEMTTQLGTALRAGLPLMNCLEVIAKQTTKPSMKALIEDLSHSVSTGHSLSEAMDKYDQHFSPLYRAMIRVGETGGILDQTMVQLVGLLKREEKIKVNMQTAMLYPAVVLSVGILSVIIIVTFVLPKIVELISENGVALPLPTRMLMALSDFMRGYGWLVAIALVVGWFGWRWWKRTSEGRLIWDSVMLKIPFVGRVQKAIAVGRFARTLGSLATGGITILEALGVVRDTLGNERLAREIDYVSQKVRTGESLADPLSESNNFPELLVQVVSVGEQTGKLDELLFNAADAFDSQADEAIARFMAVFPVVLVLLLAIMVVFILAATLMPIVMMQLNAFGA